MEWWGWQEDLRPVFAQCHIVCLPSYREGLPKVLIEAAAAGRAIVTTDTAGCREIVREGENGLLVPVADATSLSQSLRRLIEDRKLRAKLGAAGREIAVAEFTTEQVIAETFRVYRALLSVSSRPEVRRFAERMKEVRKSAVGATILSSGVTC